MVATAAANSIVKQISTIANDDFDVYSTKHSVLIDAIIINEVITHFVVITKMFSSLPIMNALYAAVQSHIFFIIISF